MSKKQKIAEHVPAYIDLIFVMFDECLLSGRFDIIDSAFKYITTEYHLSVMEPAIVVSLLTASLPARKQLQNREEFFRLAKLRFEKERGIEETFSLLRGLE